MPVISILTSALAAGAQNDNVLQGSQFEFMPYNALLEFGIVAAGAGIVADVYSGQDTLAEAMSVSPANRFPVYPDDFSLTDVAAAGERIKVRLRNTSGGALDVRTVVRVTPA
jgi:hypothetical protein